MEKHKRHPERNVSGNLPTDPPVHVCLESHRVRLGEALCRINKSKAFWSITEQSWTQRASWQAVRGCKLIIHELGDYPSPFILCSDSCYLTREITENREAGELICTIWGEALFLFSPVPTPSPPCLNQFVALSFLSTHSSLFGLVWSAGRFRFQSCWHDCDIKAVPSLLRLRSSERVKGYWQWHTDRPHANTDWHKNKHERKQRD